MTTTIRALVLAALLLLLTAPGALAVSDTGVENGLSVACGQADGVVVLRNPLCGF